jgi:beta-lactam-binding protein with PASTA domain/serine/threonine protein kinase
MDTTLARPPIGQLLDGRYRVESHLAHGGMATVYLGTDMRLDRAVALKIMHAELAKDEDFVHRFVSEARSVARLSHPNVVTVYDQGADGRTLYLAMEYVPGQTLRQFLHERGRLNPREALDIMEGVLAGLAAAHEAGIAHRDVKPENVLLGQGHTVKVADFGLARLLSGVSHTRTGMIIGTAAYLAPEQVAGGTTDVRTDVYAAGVMLFELLTGSQPHTGESPLAVAYKHINEIVPPPSALVPGLPPALDALVALTTSRDPDLRPADAGQFLQAITGVRHSLPPTSALRRPSTGSPPTASAGGAAMAVPPPAWPPGGAALDLIPGMAPVPARQSFGSARDDTTGSAATHQLTPGHPGVTNRTLIVSPGAGAPPGARHQRGYFGLSEPPLQRLLFSKRLGYVAVAVAAVLVIGGLSWWVAAGRYTTVPKVGGMTAVAAKAELRNAGLAVRTGKSQLDNAVAKGAVIRTIPASGSRIRRGGHVTLIVSLGPHMITVPQVTGQSLDAARAALQHAGLTPGKVKAQPSATIPVGIVVSTSPAAGVSWPQPQAVKLVVSAGPPIPNFVGGQKSDAEAWATQNGVSLNEVTARKSDQPTDTIIRQSPSPGGAFTKGEVITIVISPGPQMVTIPNLDGMTVRAATKTLKHLGFQVSVIQIGPLHAVFNYSPSGQAPDGSTVTLWAGLPPPG